MATADASSSRSEASVRARRQLRRVLLVLAVLDGGVLLAILGLAVAWEQLRLTNPVFLLAVLGALGGVVSVRIVLAIRLRRRSGEL